MIIIIPAPTSQRDYKTWEKREKLFSSPFCGNARTNTLAAKFYWPLIICEWHLHCHRNYKRGPTKTSGCQVNISHNRIYYLPLGLCRTRFMTVEGKSFIEHLSSGRFHHDCRSGTQMNRNRIITWLHLAPAPFIPPTWLLMIFWAAVLHAACTPSHINPDASSHLRFYGVHNPSQQQPC